MASALSKKAIVIDDEPSARKNLINILSMVCPHVEVVQQADSVKSARAMLDSMQVELVFLDIDLGDGNAFDLLDQIKEKNFDLIFVTGRNDFGIKAFQYSALDYVLKPIDPENLKRAVAKSSRNLEQFIDQRFQLLFENYRHQRFQKIALPFQDGVEIVATSNIEYCEAKDNYCQIVLDAPDKQKSLLVSRNIGQMEELMPGFFYRTHKSFLINLHKIERVLKIDGGYVVMESKAEIPIARRRKEHFYERLAQL